MSVPSSPRGVGLLRYLAPALALAALALVLPASAGAHSERPSFFPNPDAGNFPTYQTTSPRLVVCKPDSGQRIEQLSGAVRDRNRRLLPLCAFSDIQAAVNAAQTGDRILVLPGVYEEIPSRNNPEPDPACADFYTPNEGGSLVPSYEYHLRCPNARNLIAIMGDTNPGNDNPNDPSTRVCDSKCNLQIEGTGARPADVLIQGTRTKMNIIHADRADGIYLKNFATEISEDNNIYVLETNGFHVNRVTARYSRGYGILSFTSDHGIYENCSTSFNGDSGLYPGSGPDRHGQPDAHGHVYGIEIRNCQSFRNALGTSGTSGNGTWFHDNRLHHNAIGVVTDSFVPNHPGMPQDASKWSNNQIYSNNYNVFTNARDEYCATYSWYERGDDFTKVCPTFPVPVGTGVMIAGGNDNIVEGNHIYDNWRYGTMLFAVPATFRGEDDPAKQNDTSVNNRYTANQMGLRPSGQADPNGLDFWWDEQEGLDNETLLGNCWTQTGASRNVGIGGAPTSDPAVLPECPGLDLVRAGNTEKQAFLVPCATWSAADSRNPNTDPPGCDWFTTPPEPQP